MRAAAFSLRRFYGHREAHDGTRHGGTNHVEQGGSRATGGQCRNCHGEANPPVQPLRRHSGSEPAAGSTSPTSSGQPHLGTTEGRQTHLTGGQRQAAKFTYTPNCLIA